MSARRPASTRRTSTPEALAVARDNALRLGAYNVGFAEGNLYEGLRAPWGRFNLIVSNPPYIPSVNLASLPADIRRFEPRSALDGGADGLSVLRRIIDGAPRFLARSGALAVEVGAGEAPAVAELMGARGFRDVRRTCDYGKIERVVHGVWAGAHDCPAPVRGR